MRLASTVAKSGLVFNQPGTFSQWGEYWHSTHLPALVLCSNCPVLLFRTQLLHHLTPPPCGLLFGPPPVGGPPSPWKMNVAPVIASMTSGVGASSIRAVASGEPTLMM